MFTHMIEILGWFVVPVIAAILTSWSVVTRRINELSVQYSRLEVKMNALDVAVKDATSHRQEEELHMREVLQRLARMEQKLEHVVGHLDAITSVTMKSPRETK